MAALHISIDCKAAADRIVSPQRAGSGETMSVMGVLLYGPSSAEIEIDDRTLAHLQIVILARFRRHESCSLSWAHSHSAGSGRETIWLHPAIPLRFQYSLRETGPVNRVWLEEMSAAASRGDLRVTPEPESEIHRLSAGR